MLAQYYDACLSGYASYKDYATLLQSFKEDKGFYPRLVSIDLTRTMPKTMESDDLYSALESIRVG